MAKNVPIETVLLMWTLTIFMAVFWYYLPEYLGTLSDIFLMVTVICSVISFRISIKRK